MLAPTMGWSIEQRDLLPEEGPVGPAQGAQEDGAGGDACGRSHVICTALYVSEAAEPVVCFVGY